MRTVYLIISILLFVSCSDQETTSCADHKKGNFYTNTKNNISGFSMERTDSIQVEKNTRTGLEKNYFITWINDCEYQLQLIDEQKSGEGLRIFNKGIFDSLSKLPSTTVIIATSKDYYVFETRKKGIDLVYRDTAWVLK
jgi:hypothetical protein